MFFYLVFEVLDKLRIKNADIEGVMNTLEYKALTTGAWVGVSNLSLTKNNYDCIRSPGGNP